MYARRFSFVVILLVLFLQGMNAQDFYVRFRPIENDGSLEATVGEFNDGIRSAVENCYPDNFKSSNIPNERNQIIFDIKPNLRINNKKLNFSIEILRTGNVTPSKSLYKWDRNFEYKEKESVIEFIAEKLVREFNYLFHDENGSAFESQMKGITDQFHPEERSVGTVTSIKPQWKSIPNDSKVYVEKVEFRSDLAGFQIEEQSDNADRFLLNSRYIERGKIGNEEAELSAYLGSIKPVYKVNGAVIDDRKELSADSETISEYRVVFSFNNDNSYNKDLKINFTNNTVERTYKIRRLPEYDFALKDYQINAGSLTCSFQNTTPLIYDLKVFLPDYGDPKRSPVHYLYIDNAVAEFFNANNGNLELVLSENFKFQVSLVRYDNSSVTPFKEVLGYSQDDKKAGFLEMLNNVRLYGKEIIKAVNQRDNVYSLPRISERIETNKADWFVKMEFTPSGELNDDGLIMLGELENIKPRSNLPISGGSADIIYNYIIRAGKGGYERNPNFFLDIAKILMYLGYRVDASDFIRFYKESLEKSRTDLYALNNRNEKYIISFYEKLADYYSNLRQGRPLGYSPPPDDLLNKDISPDELINRMKRFTGLSGDSQVSSLSSGVLFEVRKKQAANSEPDASEFLKFNFQELLENSIFRLPGILPEDLVTLRRVFIR